jgi:hypothetical protein
MLITGRRPFSWQKRTFDGGRGGLQLTPSRHIRYRGCGNPQEAFIGGLGESSGSPTWTTRRLLVVPACPNGIPATTTI